jgi:ubiquinone/menaquinone biosynthesis C-methylase UbiE
MKNLDFTFFQDLDVDYRNSHHLMYKKMRLILGYVKPGKRLIDVGCGTGEFLVQLRDRFESLVGIDVNSDSIEFASEKVERFKRISVYDGELQSFQFPNEHFDTCLCLDVLEHVQNPLALLQEIHRIVRAGAEVIATVPNWYDKIVSGVFRINPAHVHTLSPWTWMRLLRNAGFKIKYYRAVDFPVFHSEMLSKKIPSLGMCILMVAVK